MWTATSLTVWHRMPVPELAAGRVDLWDGWSLELPSPCRTTRNADGSWSAWDETRAIDIDIVSVSGHSDGSPFPAEKMLGMPATISGHDGSAHGSL